MYGKTSAPFRPGKTREWGGMVACAEWHEANRGALIRLVTDPAYDSPATVAKSELKTLVLDLDTSFWPILPQLIALVQPIRLAIFTLMNDNAKLSDVMAAFVRIHEAQMTFVASPGCTLTASTKSSLRSINQQRFKFLYHPVHLVAFALDPRYAQKCKAAPSVLRYWMKTLHMEESDEEALVNEYGRFRASMSDPAQADIWTAAATADPVGWYLSWGDEFPTLTKLALRVLSCAPSAAGAERNWSTQDYIVSKRRNRLTPQRAEKLVYIYFNSRSLARSEAQRRGPGITVETLERWHSSFVVHPDFHWPNQGEGKQMFEWDGDDDEDTEFIGMHGDEIAVDDEGEEDIEDCTAPKLSPLPSLTSPHPRPLSLTLTL
jgi:hypothetical protein